MCLGTNLKSVSGIMCLAVPTNALLGDILTYKTAPEYPHLILYLPSIHHPSGSSRM